MDRQGTPIWGNDSDWDSTNVSQHAYDNSAYQSQQQSPPHGYDNSAPQPVQPSAPVTTEALLMQMFSAMREEAAEARQFQREQAALTSRALNSMTAAIQALNNVSSVPSTAAAVPATPRSSAPSVDRPLKAREPRMYNGTTAEVEPFIDEIETNIRLQRMHDDLDKTGYFSTYLKDGNAKTWYYTIKSYNVSLLSDFPAFLAAFRAHFADPNYSRTALHKIKALKQQGSCGSYAARFLELLPHVSFSDQTKLDQFKEGLKPAVRDLVRGVRPKPATFEDYLHLAIDFDNDLHEDELAARDRSHGSRPSASSSRPAPRQAASAPAASSEVVLMEVDAVKFRGPLTETEKDRRRQLNLCMYCAGAGHTADTCPNKSVKAKSAMLRARLPPPRREKPDREFIFSSPRALGF